MEKILDYFEEEIEVRESKKKEGLRHGDCHKSLEDILKLVQEDYSEGKIKYKIPKDKYGIEEDIFFYREGDIKRKRLCECFINERGEYEIFEF